MATTFTLWSCLLEDERNLSMWQVGIFVIHFLDLPLPFHAGRILKLWWIRIHFRPTARTKKPPEDSEPVALIVETAEKVIFGQAAVNQLARWCSDNSQIETFFTGSLDWVLPHLRIMLGFPKLYLRGRSSCNHFDFFFEALYYLRRIRFNRRLCRRDMGQLGELYLPWKPFIILNILVVPQ